MDCEHTHSKDLNLSFTNDEYQGNPDCAGPILSVGPLMEPRLVSAEEGAYLADCAALRAAGKRLVLLSMGTAVTNSVDFFALCHVALGPMEAEGVHVMMATGRALEGGPTKVPANFHCLSPFVPQLDCLQLALAFVTHGGMNSAQEALWYGNPMVVIPGFGDQPWNGERVEALGVRPSCERSELTAEGLGSAVKRVLDGEAYTARAQAIGEGLRACGGVKAVVGAINAV